jgi:hypothetical protein
MLLHYVKIASVETINFHLLETDIYNLFKTGRGLGPFRQV